MALTGLTACGDNDTGDGSAADGDQTVTVGAVLSTSGYAAQIGAEGEMALRAFEDIWRFSDGRRIRFEIVNDQSDPTQAIAAVDTLADKGITAIIGFNAGGMYSAFPRLVELQIPVLFGPPIPYPNFNAEPYIFSSNLHQLSVQVQDFLDYMDALGLHKPLVLTSDDAVGESVEQAWSEVDVDVEVVPLDVTNYQPILSDARGAGYDALVTIGSAGEPPAHASRAREALAWDVDQFLAPSNLVQDYLTLAGDAAEGVRGFLWPAGAGSAHFADNPDQQEVVESLEAALPDVEIALHPNIGYYWDHALSVALAVEETDSTDPAEIREALETQEFWGANGLVRRNADDHVGYQRESAIRAIVRDGTIVPAEDA